MKNKRIWILFSSVFLLLIWYAASVAVGKELILPDPFITVKYTFVMLHGSEAWQAIGATAARVLFSFSVNLSLALVIGSLSGFYKTIDYLLKPVIAIMRAVPTMGVILLSLIWFNSETAVVFVCTLIVFPVFYSSISEGIRNLDKKLIEMNKIFRIGVLKKTFHFILPSLSPYITSGISSGIGLAMKVVIAAEVLSQPDKGIGTMFQIEKANLNTAGVFAWSLIVILLTTFVDSIFLYLKKKHGK